MASQGTIPIFQALHLVKNAIKISDTRWSGFKG